MLTLMLISNTTVILGAIAFFAIMMWIEIVYAQIRDEENKRR